jgi:hypothetical protein
MQNLLQKMHDDAALYQRTIDFLFEGQESLRNISALQQEQLKILGKQFDQVMIIIDQLLKKTGLEKSDIDDLINDILKRGHEN